MLNDGESTVLFCFIFSFFAFAGGRPWTHSCFGSVRSTTSEAMFLTHTNEHSRSQTTTTTPTLTAWPINQLTVVRSVYCFEEGQRLLTSARPPLQALAQTSDSPLRALALALRLGRTLIKNRGVVVLLQSNFLPVTVFFAVQCCTF